MPLNNEQVQEAVIALLEIIGDSLLPSKLEDIATMPGKTFYLHIQSGDADGKRINVEKLRGFGGSYNPTTNTPALSNASGIEGTYYVSSAAGSRDFGNGIVSIAAGDILKFEGGKWKVPFNVTSISSIKQVIQLGDIGSSTVKAGFDAFTNANPVVVQPLSKGYTHIEATQDGVSREWIFVGNSGTYDESNFPTDKDFLSKVNQRDLYLKDEVDALLNGLKWKDPVDAATTGNIVLSGEQTIDGFATNASRILVKNNTDATENGLYDTAAGAWTRTADADEDSELPGSAVYVLNGTDNQGQRYTCNNITATLGTTAINFAKFSDIIQHNSSTGLQGGTQGEYYHLTADQLALLISVEQGATNDAVEIADHESRLSVFELRAGQVIDLGDILSDTIENAFNDDTFTNGDISIDPPTNGYTLVKAVQNGTAKRWLFVGSPATYSSSVLAVTEDFFGGNSGDGGTGEVHVIDVDTIWNTGDDTTFPVPDSDKVTNVLVNGSDLREGFEWSRSTATEISILRPINNGDWVKIESSATAVQSGGLTAQQEQDLADSKKDVISYALSSPGSDLSAGDTDSFNAPYDFTLDGYFAGVAEAPTGSALVIGLKKNGASVTSSDALIDAGETTSLTGTAPVITTTSFVKGDLITPVISQVGSLNTGKSLKIYLEITKV